MGNGQVIDFYNNFSFSQKKTGINERLWLLYKRMIGFGLKKNSNVLELGCGIGAMTWLISKKVKQGTIEAVDISDESIAFAKKQNRKSSIRFFSHDVVTYKPELSTIDFITLFDVIEHIPINKHNNLFKNIASYMNEDTCLLINIPNPDYIEYDRKHQPEVLQIIDQPVYHDDLYAILNKNGLDLRYYKK